MQYAYSSTFQADNRQHAPTQVTPADVAQKIEFKNGYFDGFASIVEAVLGRVPSLRNGSSEYAASFVLEVHESLRERHSHYHM